MGAKQSKKLNGERKAKKRQPKFSGSKVKTKEELSMHPVDKLLATVAKLPSHPAREKVSNMLRSLKSPIVSGGERGSVPVWSLLHDLAAFLAVQQEDETPSQKLLEGCLHGDVSVLDQLPSTQPLEMLVFISSTFTDTQAERDLLIQDVFPYLDSLGQVLGVNFQPIELRWGVTESLQTDEGIQDICKRHIQRCINNGHGLCFAYLGTDKYGYRPIPHTLEVSVMDFLKKEMVSSKSHFDLLSAFYLLDENSIPASYTLITGYPESLSRNTYGTLIALLQEAVKLAVESEVNIHDVQQLYNDSGSELLLDPNKSTICNKLLPFVHKSLRSFVIASVNLRDNRDSNSAWMSSRAGSGATLRHKLQLQFGSSVTEQEVVQGILSRQASPDRVFCFDRRIKDLKDQVSKYLVEHGKTEDAVRPLLPFLDFEKVTPNAYQFDSQAQESLSRLKDNALPLVLDTSQISKYEVTLDEILSGSMEHYLADFANDFCCIAAASMLQVKLSEQQFGGGLFSDIVLHLHALKEFHGKFIALPELKNLTNLFVEFLQGLPPQPSHSSKCFAIRGPSGSGKSVLLASLAMKAMTELQGRASIIYRSATVQTGSIATLLVSVGEQLYRSGNHNFQLPTVLTFESCQSFFLGAVATIASQSNPVILFIDGIDAISGPGGIVFDESFGLRPNLYVVLSYTSLQYVSPVFAAPATHDIPALTSVGAKTLMLESLKTQHRRLKPTQIQVVEELLVKCTSRTAFELPILADVVKTWTSRDTPTLGRDTTSLSSVIDMHLTRLEQRLNPLVVKYIFGLLAVARDGLSIGELEDILSLDDDVLDSIFEWWTPPIRKCPRLIVTQVIESLDSLLEEHRAVGSMQTVLRIAHEAMREKVSERYIAMEASKSTFSNLLADYFSGRWASAGKVYKGKLHKRGINPQDLIDKSLGSTFTVDQDLNVQFPHQYNMRKFREYPEHLAASARWEELLQFVGSIDTIRCQALSDSSLYTDIVRFYKDCLDHEQDRNALQQQFEDYLSISIETKRSNYEISMNSSGLALNDARDLAYASDLELATDFLRQVSMFDAAIAFQEKAVSIRRRLNGESIVLADSLNLLDTVKYRAGADPNTSPEKGPALKLYAKLLGDDCQTNPKYATLLGNYGAHLRSIYNVTKDRQLLVGAVAARQQALEIRKSVYGEMHTETAKAMNGLALAKRMLGEYEEAYTLSKNAMKVRETILGKFHPDIAMNLIALANLQKHLKGKEEDPEALLQRAFQIRFRHYGMRSHKTAMAMVAIADLHSEEGYNETGVEMYEHAARTFARIQKSSQSRDYASAAKRSSEGVEHLLKTVGIDKSKVLSLLRQALPERDNEYLVNIGELCYWHIEIILMNLQLHIDAEPLLPGSILIKGEVEVPKRCPESDLHLCRLNKLLKPDSLSGAEVASLLKAVVSDPQPIIEQFGNPSKDQNIVVTASHSVMLIRDGTRVKSRDLLTHSIARDIANGLGARTLRWSFANTVRSMQTLTPLPNADDPNYIHPEKMRESPWYLAMKSLLTEGKRSSASRPAFHVDVHGMKNWVDPDTNKPGGFGIGIGAMEKVSSSKSREKLITVFASTLVNNLNNAFDGHFASMIDTFYAGAGKAHYRTMTNQAVDISGDSVISVQLEISLDMRTLLLFDHSAVQHLVKSLQGAYDSVVSPL